MCTARVIAQPLLLILLAVPTRAQVPATQPVTIGSQLELFVDAALIAHTQGAALRLHSPVRQETVFTFDAPWEGPESGYVAILHDGTRWRMYYRGGGEQTREHACLAFSEDGRQWTRPTLGLFESNGSKDNNIIWTGPNPAYCQAHNFTPFLDANPAAPPDQRWKAVTLDVAQLPGESDRRPVLAAYVSSDGIHWRRLQDAPILTVGSFDSQNVAFWDAARATYVCYARIGRDGKRNINRATSTDFVHWTPPVLLDYGDAPIEHFYTNAITPYPRAPHLLLGFPMRFVPPAQRATVGYPPRKTDGLSDAVFMSSRDGVHWQRPLLEAFLRPGLDPGRWGGAHGNNTPAWGLVQTGPTELSVYWAENYGTDNEGRARIPRLARGTVRLDGFASMHAGYAGGEFITHPLVFAGCRLRVNFSTSAVGSVRVELQDAAGTPLPGYALADAEEIWGDELERVVTWKGGENVAALAGQPVRLRFVLKDADVFAFCFGE